MEEEEAVLLVEVLLVAHHHQRPLVIQVRSYTALYRHRTHTTHTQVFTLEWLLLRLTIMDMLPLLIILIHRLGT